MKTNLKKIAITMFTIVMVLSVFTISASAKVSISSFNLQGANNIRNVDMINLQTSPDTAENKFWYRQTNEETNDIFFLFFGFPSRVDIELSRDVNNFGGTEYWKTEINDKGIDNFVEAAHRVQFGAF
jgi:hypothetical protein